MKHVRLAVSLAMCICLCWSPYAPAAEKRLRPGGSYLEENVGMPSPGSGGGCIPTTCEKEGATCGNLSDGCGKVLDCGLVTKVLVTVDPQKFSGKCPKRFTFTGTITTQRKGTLHYQWLNAPYVSQQGDLAFAAAGSRQVSFAWDVPGNLLPNKQWLSLVTTQQQGDCSGEKVQASTAFVLKCTSLKPIGGSTFPQ